MKRRPKRILRGAVVAFAVAAFAAPTAQAKLGPASAGTNVNTIAVSSSAPPLLSTSSDGFAWGDAFVGGATTLATTIVLAFAAVGARRPRQPVRA